MGARSAPPWLPSRDSPPLRPIAANWTITARGTAIRWPDLDEDIGLAGLLGLPETVLEHAAGFTIHADESSDR